MTEINNRRALSQVYDIICHMEEKMRKKIPTKFIEAIKENMDENYKVDIDYTLGINNQELLIGTRAMLSLIYRNYICEEEEKVKFFEDKSSILIKEQANKGVSHETFKEKMKQINSYVDIDKTTETSLVAENVNTSWYNKLLKKLKEIFKIK